MATFNVAAKAFDADLAHFVQALVLACRQGRVSVLQYIDDT